MINITSIKNLMNLPLNIDSSYIVRALVPIIEEMAMTIDALTGELVSDVQITQPSGTNSVQVKVVKEDETSIDSNTVTITQPTE